MREFLRRQVRNAHSVLSADRALIVRVFRNFIWLTMGNATSMSFGFLATVYIARTLGKSDFGKATFAMTISVYASVVVDLGLNTYGNRAVDRNPDRLRECLGNILGFQLVVAFALIALTALSAIFFRGSADPELRLLIFLSMLWLVPFACNMDWVFLGIETMSVVGGARLVQQMALIAYSLGNFVFGGHGRRADTTAVLKIVLQGESV